MQSWTWRFRGRRSIWWGYRVTLLAPRIVNDVSYVTRINHEIHFAWQAQYLVKLECYFSWQAQHLVTFWEIAGARNVVFFHTKCVSKVGRGRSPRRRVRDDDFMLGSWSDYPRIVFILAEAIQRVSNAILNLKISWQAQYLVRLEGDFACSAHWKWRFICDADQSWDSFCVAGAVFGEIRGWLCLLRALEMTFHMWRGSIMRSWQAQYLVRFEVDFACSAHSKWCFICDADQSWFILRGRRSIWWGSRLTLLAPRILNDVSYVRRINHEIHFAWQAQYLVKVEGDSCCSAHSKWRFICEADQWRDSFCVAGAVFGEVGAWLLLLRFVIIDYTIEE